MFSYEIHRALKILGQRLRSLRLERDDTQRVFAARLGVSIPTLRAMENGDPKVRVGTWAKALWVLDRLEDVDQLLKTGSLFDRYDRSRLEKNTPQRASRRKIDR